MTLELLESTELDFIDFWYIYRGISRIFLKKKTRKSNNLVSLRANNFIFIGYLKTGGGGLREPPEPPLDLPLV